MNNNLVYEEECPCFYGGSCPTNCIHAEDAGDTWQDWAKARGARNMPSHPITPKGDNS